VGLIKLDEKNSSQMESMMNMTEKLKEIPYWLDPQPLTKSYTDNPLPGKKDVLVIGGGFTGTTAAIRLKQAGPQVTLIDREKLGTTASARNGGITNTAFADQDCIAIPFYRGNPWFMPLINYYLSVMDRIK
jgi:hypothetical protein